MRISAKVFAAGLLAVLCVNFVLSDTAVAAFDEADIEKKLAAILTYDRGMDTQPLIAVEQLIRESQNQPEQRKYIELRLAQLLAEATLEGKSFICRQLWFIGTADSVPAVAKLLTDEKTADMACYAIGQNPSQEAGEALRDALDKTPPKVQIRIINLLGDRRDARSVEAIGKLVFGPERDVAEAAAGALGKIGGAQAREILVKARAAGDSQLRFAATDAYLRCAEDLVAAGESEQATAIYKELVGEDEAGIIRSAAIKGLADIGGREVVPLVLAALRDQDRMVRTTARGCIRTAQGEGVTELLAAELSRTSPDEQVLLIGALADRGDPAALPAITAATGNANAQVREAALGAVGKLGDARSVALLVQVATAGVSSEEKGAALNSLRQLRGGGVDDAIVKNMQASQPDVRSRLIQVLLDRNAVGAVPALLAEAVNPDLNVRKAAFKALGRLAGEGDLPALVELLVKLQDDSSRREAERAAVAASRKIGDENRRADVVLAALSADKRVPVRCSLLRVLGGIANSKALERLADASKETDPTMRDTAVRALVNWPNATAAEVLLQIYRQTQSRIHRLLALRGFVRLLALPAGDRPVRKTLQMCRDAMSHAHSSDEKKLMLSGLANVNDPEALTMVEPFLQTEAVSAEAGMAAIKIAGAIVESHHDQARMAMSKLLAVSQDQRLREQAEEVIRRIEEFEDGTPKADR